MTAERELMLTGIGGQGVQLAAEVLARAAVREGRHVMLFGSYGGTMRGGQTDATLVVAEEPIQSPPIVARLWGAVAMHHAFWPAVERKLRPGAVVLVNSSLFDGELDRESQRVFEVPATQLATDAGSPLSASLVLAGAFAGVTGLLGVDAVVEAMRASLPPYRQQHAAANERALRAGFEMLPQGACPAWPAENAA